MGLFSLEPAQWGAVCLLLLVNPISVISLTPAIALIGCSFVVYILALLLMCLLLNARPFQHFLRYGVCYFAQYPHKALVFYGLGVVLCLPRGAFLLQPMASAMSPLARVVLTYITSLRTLAACRLV